MCTPTTYFASTRLELKQSDRADELPQDLCLDGVRYRKVDPAYYAWLRRQMETARLKFKAGKLPDAKWEQLRRRFNQLNEWAIAHYGKASLQEAVRDFKPEYIPPQNPEPAPYLFPATGVWRFSKTVNEAAIRKVDAIRDKAIANGWSEARLYQNRGHLRFPLGRFYGLVCFLGPEDSIGKITPAYIETIHASAHRSDKRRFINADTFGKRSKQ